MDIKSLPVLMETCSDYELIYDANAENPFIVQSSDGTVRENFKNPIEAIASFINRAEASLRKRAKKYCKKHSLNEYTGEELS